MDPGRLRLSQGASLKPAESEGCSPVSGGRAIYMRLTERSGWLAVRTPKFPAGDLAGAAQAALAIVAYYHDLGYMASAHAWVCLAVAEAPAGTTVAIATRISDRGW